MPDGLSVFAPLLANLDASGPTGLRIEAWGPVSAAVTMAHRGAEGAAGERLSAFARNDPDATVLKIGPGTWLIFCNDDAVALPDLDDVAATFDQGDSYALLRLRGAAAITVLQKGIFIDLRSVLARISKAANEPEKEKTDSAPIEREMTVDAPTPEAISPLKAALSALEKVDQSGPRLLPPRPVSAASLPPLSPLERAEIEHMANEAEAAFAALETKQFTLLPPPPTASDTAHTTPQIATHDPLSPKTIAKLLRSSGTERSPFK